MTRQRHQPSLTVAPKMKFIFFFGRCCCQRFWSFLQTAAYLFSALPHRVCCLCDNAEQVNNISCAECCVRHAPDTQAAVNAIESTTTETSTHPYAVIHTHTDTHSYTLNLYKSSSSFYFKRFCVMLSNLCSAHNTTQHNTPSNFS